MARRCEKREKGSGQMDPRGEIAFPIPLAVNILKADEEPWGGEHKGDRGDQKC